MKKKLAAAAVILAVLTAVTGCYPLRIARPPADVINTQEAYASETAGPVESEPAVTETATEEATAEPTGTAEATEEATAEATEQASEEPTQEATEQATASPAVTVAPTANPETPAPGTTPTPTPAVTPAPSATPTPKPTATPTPKPTATPTPAPSSDFAEFSSASINGYPNFTNAAFSNAKLTMVNFWATWCGPCIEELPDIQQLSSAYSGRMQVITVLYDSQQTGAVDQALSIMNSIGLTIPVIRCNSSLKKAFTAHDSLSALPTTFFVDQNGHIVNIAKGSHTYSQWCALINGLL